MKGKVVFIGADLRSELITVKASKVISQADVIIYADPWLTLKFSDTPKKAVTRNSAQMNLTRYWR